MIDSKFLKDNWYYILFTLVGMLLICIYYIFKPTSGDPHVILYAIKELGMAMLIAICLVISIEAVTRQRHHQAAQKWQEDAHQNIFKAIFNRYIPEAVFAEVEECLLRNKVYRDGYEITYTLSEFCPSTASMLAAGHYIADVKSTYKIVNMTDRKIVHDLLTSLDVPNESAYVSYTEITSYKVDGVEQLESCVKADSKGICSASVKVTLDAKGTAQILMTGRTVKRKIDSETWASRIPSTGITVFVTAPDNVEVTCIAKNSHPIIQNEARNFAKTKVWELNNGVFPHQSVVMHWNGTK